MKIFLIEKHYYTKEDGNKTHEYNVMPYCLKSTIKAMGLWSVFRHICGGRAYFSEGMARHNAKYIEF